MLDPQGLYAWEPKGLGVVDMALFDLASKIAGQPLPPEHCGPRPLAAATATKANSHVVRSVT